MSFFSKKEPKIKKLSIVSFSGEYDRALVAFNLATSAATIGYEVHMFFTFWGLNIIKKEKGRRMIGSSPVQKITHFFMGGSKNLPLSRFNFFGFGKHVFRRRLKKKNVASISDLLKAALALKVQLYAFNMPVSIFGTKDSDFLNEVKAISTEEFLTITESGQVLFI